MPEERRFLASSTSNHLLMAVHHCTSPKQRAIIALDSWMRSTAACLQRFCQFPLQRRRPEEGQSASFWDFCLLCLQSKLPSASPSHGSETLQAGQWGSDSCAGELATLMFLYPHRLCKDIIVFLMSQSFHSIFKPLSAFSGAHQCGQGTAILDSAYNSALFSADQDLQRTYC